MRNKPLPGFCKSPLKKSENVTAMSTFNFSSESSHKYGQPPTGKNKVIVDKVVDFLTPSNALEAIPGGGWVGKIGKTIGKSLVNKFTGGGDDDKA